MKEQIAVQRLCVEPAQGRLCSQVKETGLEGTVDKPKMKKRGKGL